MGRQVQYVTFQDAVRQLKASRNRAIFLFATTAAQKADDETKGYNLSGCIKVSAPQAIKFLTSAYQGLEEKALVAIEVDERCFFVGTGAY